MRAHHEHHHHPFPHPYLSRRQGRPATLTAELEVAALSLSRDDVAGIKWCEKHGYHGYTSYASLNDLAWRIPVFQKLERILDRHALAFAKALHWDIKGGKPVCDSLWVNVLRRAAATPATSTPTA